MPVNYSSREFEAQYTYKRNDLGAVWSRERTCFRVWAPTAQSVRVMLYPSGDPRDRELLEFLEMRPDTEGTWVAEKQGDLHGIYYTYQVCIDGKETEACDPYARAVGVNGHRAMVIDLRSTDPAGWETDADPNAGLHPADAVIYELHVRDLSTDDSSGIRAKGTYLGLSETGTTTKEGIPTGLDHIKSLGITHLQLLPIYDFGYVDEAKSGRPSYNWGYDPVNYNVPEGSYSSDPFHGEVRVAEVKKMVKALHDHGISVIMDVVYNHVYQAENFCFNRIVPGYFSRSDASGTLSNGSCCGNDTASERSMVRKYIIDSVKYWADEYHIDGFRFDLVGLIDTVTINSIMHEVHKDHPNALFYGEGWSMDTRVTKRGVLLTTKENADAVPGFAFFNDTIRDLLKGSVFDNTAPGFISGQPDFNSDLLKCYMGLPHWASGPVQSINYVSCHDNHTLMDRITLSTPDASQADRIRMNNLAAAFYLTAQGIPFIHAGEDFLRSKPLPDGRLDHNSYHSPDSVNSIKWSDLEKPEYRAVTDYYRGLIAFRKAHAVLRLSKARDVLQTAASVATGNRRSAAFSIKGQYIGMKEPEVFAIFNADTAPLPIPLPRGKWNVFVNDSHAGTQILDTLEGMIKVAPISALILVKA